MSFETPVVSRLSLAPVGSPIRKKSVLALANQESATTALNDDDAERRERRRKSLAPLATPTSDVADKSDETRRKSMGLGTVSGLSAAQLAEHYANCIKLSTENKITVKNAFNLQLIDYMKYMLQKHDKQMEDFQVASCTLDASTKIYSYRVDSVHSDVVQMASGFGRLDNNKRKDNPEEGAQDGDQNEGAADNESDTERQRSRILKKKRRNKAVIATKKESLLRKQNNYKSLDTFITRLSANLAVSQAGDCPFLCSIKNADDQSSEDSPAEVALDLQLKPDIINGEICPAFSDFSLKGWKPEDDPSPQEATPGPAPPALDNSGLAFDMNKTPEPIPDYDPGDDNLFDDDHDHDAEMNDMYAAPEVGFRSLAQQQARKRANVVNLHDHLSTVPLEYSYFQTSIMSLWAGPNHWKIKPIKKGVETDEKCARERKKRQRKLVVLNYDDVKEFSQGPSTATELTKKTFAGWSKDKHLLPVNIFSTPESFMTLFTRPSARVAVHDEFNAAEVDDAVPEYPYDNPVDKSDFCPNLPPEDDDNDNDIGADMDVGSQDDEDMPMDAAMGAAMDCDAPVDEQGAFTGDNLIEAPNKIARSYIPYQMRAKKVDMKKLKASIWEVLTESSDANKENISNVQEDISNESRKLQKSSTFSEVYQKVFYLLPPKMAENISCGLTFVALLHLANEKCLQIDGLPDMTDLNIRQG